MNIVTLSHGSGGQDTHLLIKNIFYKYFNNDILLQNNDSGVLKNIKGKIAVTTDSFVIKPIFFPGGDIGKLAVCGTINDLAVTGAKPLYLTTAFIIEEGFSLKLLEKIVISMADTAKKVGVKIIAGDTKVVNKGNTDKIFINTTGIGVITSDLCSADIENEDKVIVSGTLGDHGICILNEREDLNFHMDLVSDCSPLYNLTKDLLNLNVKFMRDPTRGGLATTLVEITQSCNMGITVNEKDLPVRDEVRGICSLLGTDPLYIANEGKLVVIVSKEDAKPMLEIMKKNPLGKNASIIGKVISNNEGEVYLKTQTGGTRILNMLQSEMIPRIC